MIDKEIYHILFIVLVIVAIYFTVHVIYDIIQNYLVDKKRYRQRVDANRARKEALIRARENDAKERMLRDQEYNLSGAKKAAEEETGEKEREREKEE